MKPEGELKKGLRESVVLVVAVFFLILSAPVFAQTSTENFEESLSDIAAQIATIESSGDATSDVSIQRSFFEFTNVSLWLFIIVLVCSLIFLLSLRHGMSIMTSRQPFAVRTQQQSVTEADKKNNFSLTEVASNTSASTKKQASKPIRVVRVKVRKIKKR